MKTTVFHKAAAKPCILSFSSDHPRSTPRNIIYGVLVRAARYGTNVEDFNCKRLKFELTLLTSGYTLSFNGYQFKHFFCANQALPVSKLLDVDCYQRLHMNLRSQPTRQEKKRQQMSSHIHGQASYLPTKKSWDREKLIVHYHFENGPIAQYQQEFRRLWQSYYVHDQSRVKVIQLIVGTGTDTALEHCLVKKEPARGFLGNE